MDLQQHPILAKAIEKRNALIAEADYWKRFIEDYTALNGTTVQEKIEPKTPITIKTPETVPTVNNDKVMTWTEICKEVDALLSVRGSVENASVFTEEFIKRGYNTRKESISSCLTHYRKQGHYIYNKDTGGWKLSEVQEQEGNSLFTSNPQQNTQAA